MTYILDTDWIINLLTGRKDAEEKIQNLDPQEIVISLITVAEIYESGAYLLVGGGDHCWEEPIKALVNPRQAEMEQMIEPRFAPAHAHPFEALLNEPLAGTFH